MRPIHIILTLYQSVMITSHPLPCILFEIWQEKKFGHEYNYNIIKYEYIVSTICYDYILNKYRAQDVEYDMNIL